MAEAKRSWVVECDGLASGSGRYEPGPSGSHAPAYTGAFVERAITLYDAVGLEATIACHNTTGSINGQW